MVQEKYSSVRVGNTNSCTPARNTRTAATASSRRIEGSRV